MKLLSIFAALLISYSVAGQADSIQPAYKRFPTPPPFKLLLTDSATWFTKADLDKKKPLFLYVFSPECDHCKLTTEDLVKNIDKLKKVQIVMATWLGFGQMKKFYEDFQLSRFENLTVGRDVNFIIPPFYNIRNLPYMAFYDKKGQLISVFEGGLGIDKVVEKFSMQ